MFGENERYSIENAIFDPLLLGCYLIISGIEVPGAAFTYSQIGALSHPEKQCLVDSVERMITYKDASDDERVEIEYSGNFSLSVRRQHLRWRGHDLVTALDATFESFRETKSGGDEKVMRGIVRKVVAPNPCYCPKVVADAFTELAQREISG